MPCNSGYGAPDGLLEVFRDPPVILFLEVADSNYSSTGTDGEFGLGWRPAHKSSRAVDSKEYKGWLITGR